MYDADTRAKQINSGRFAAFSLSLFSFLGTYGFAALFLVSGLMELAIWTEDGRKEPRHFGDPVVLGMCDADMRAKQINNGRFAMFSLSLSRSLCLALPPRRAKAYAEACARARRGMPRLTPRHAGAYA